MDSVQAFVIVDLFWLAVLALVIAFRMTRKAKPAHAPVRPDWIYKEDRA